MKNSISSQKFKFRDLPHLLIDTAKAWNNADPWRLSAIIAYYAVLSLPALLVIIINIVGTIWGEEIVQGKLTSEITIALGKDVADSIQSMIKNSKIEDKSFISSLIGIIVLIFASTGVFYQLQISLNKVWQLKPNPKAGILKIITDRAKSFGFIIVIGFLLLISFIVSAGISTITNFINDTLPDFMLYITNIIDIVISLAIISLLFALMFKFLPDAKIRWKSVWLGAVITAVLFVIGKFLLELYFEEMNPASTYGAAGSIVLILLWVSYSSLILFFGAEFTYIYSKRYNLSIQPTTIAIKEES
ncbi:MAG: ribonuclease BN [Flavobacteriales bacterium]|jgi:membrane protein|nr:ribonuclease BN [Flavobacteriales bacterium]|tara:strand:- start:37587 stop:38495 length:909 start_codon:yes stop_codon:yes gene_type:complete